jgi:hypothetical protein
MLDVLWASAALYAKPELHFSARLYEKLVTKLTSFKYNSQEQPDYYVYDRIIAYSEKAENLNSLDNAVSAAYGMLSEKQKELVRLSYFDRMHRESVVERMKLKIWQYKWIRSSALQKIAFFLDFFGFDNDRFLIYFNEEPCLIRNGRYAKIKSAVPDETDEETIEKMAETV